VVMLGPQNGAVADYPATRCSIMCAIIPAMVSQVAR
jgi:hypothetical protein